LNFTTGELIFSALFAILLLAMNAAFVATEFSLVKLRFTRFGTGQMKRARESKSISKLLERISDSIKVLRLGITMSTIASGFLLVPLALASAQELGWEGNAQVRGAVILAFVVAVCLHFVLGELVPRVVALNHPVPTLRISAPVFLVFRLIIRPLSAPLNGFSSLVLRGLRLDPKSDLNLLDVEAQIRSLVSDGDELPQLAENIVNNVLGFGKRVAHDIMIPRNQLSYFDLEDSIEESLKIANETGHTRFPICRGDLDDCIGIVHIKDVFRSGLSKEELVLTKVMRQMIRFSMDEPLEKVLQVFLKQKKHFALLIDDFGGTVGAITMEDVLEELVGDIQDEFDKEQEMVGELEDGLFQVDGLTPLHDVAVALGIELEAEEVSTFGGFITYGLGRMPRLNEKFVIGPVEVTANAIDDRRVVAATVRVVQDEEESEGEAV